MTILIGIGHRARSGKDTIADHLCKNHNFKKISFAGLLKDGVNLWHGWDSRHAYGDLKEVVDPYWGYSPRYAYQVIGTDCIRNHHRNDFWVQAALNKAERCLEYGFNVCIPDVRFLNEMKSIEDHDGFVWRVDRPGLKDLHPEPNNRFLRWFQSSVLHKDFDHVSETQLMGVKDDDFDTVIKNDGTLDELYDKVSSLVVPLL